LQIHNIFLLGSYLVDEKGPSPLLPSPFVFAAYTMYAAFPRFLAPCVLCLILFEQSVKNDFF
jgi:hypothetical protein